MAASNSQEIDVFDPKIHLAPPGPVSTFTMTDLGLIEGASKAGSYPFPFLSQEGVFAYRRSIFHASVLKACSRPMGEGTLTLRNVASQSKFVRDMWKHPETMRRVTEALGVDLEIIMDLEIGHTNIQLSREDMKFDMEPKPGEVEMMEVEKEHDPLKGDSVIPWHHDSYPYVCIIMLSDTTHMQGGHTYIRTGDGSARKVEGPSLGTAVVLQGGEVEHLASRAFGASERITTITSYRVKKSGIWDDSSISNVRPYDKLDELYRGWSLYRLRKMRAEIEAMEKRIEKSRIEEFPMQDVQTLCEELAAYSTRTARQLIDPAIRDEMISKFGLAKVMQAETLWRKIRSVPGAAGSIQRTTEKTLDVMPMLDSYILDWHSSKAKMSLGSEPLRTRCHSLSIAEEEQEYSFPDELAKQGQNELLICWLDKMGLLDLLGPAG